MPGAKYTAIFDVGADQYGYLTVEQASEAGVRARTLHAMTRRGTLQHVSNGLYRISAISPSPRSEFMEASLWPRKVRGVISHESALVLHGLSDVNPARIHLTVPRRHRILRRVPPLYVVHRADLAPAEVEHVDGIAVTSPVRTIRDCHAAHLGRALLRQAVEDGLRLGLLRSADAERLSAELLEDRLR